MCLALLEGLHSQGMLDMGQVRQEPMRHNAEVASGQLVQSSVLWICVQRHYWWLCRPPGHAWLLIARFQGSVVAMHARCAAAGVP